TLDPMSEQHLLGALRAGDNGSFLAIEPEVAEMLTRSVMATMTVAEQRGELPVLVCAAQLRPALRRLLHNLVPGLNVLSYAEIGAQLEIITSGTVNLVSNAHV
ncbi:MAG: FHIPEP family type III secretion protein, partial [Acidimicrobiia bacterium]